MQQFTKRRVNSVHWAVDRKFCQHCCSTIEHWLAKRYLTLRRDRVSLQCVPGIGLLSDICLQAARQLNLIDVLRRSKEGERA